MDVKVERDFIEGVFYDEFSIAFDASNRFIHHNFDSENFNAVRLTFSNSTINQGMLLSAIEFEADNVSNKMKG